jgi:SOS response regulatory protein OraA/RecX
MIDDLLSEINKIQDSTSLKQISLSENERLIFNKAYNLLSRREYSEIELTTKLKQRMPEEDCLIPVVIEKLVNAGYLSNERYKEMIIKKLLKKGIATQNIINELRKHQIDVTSCEIQSHAENLNINKDQKIQQLILKKNKTFK